MYGCKSVQLHNAPGAGGGEKAAIRDIGTQNLTKVQAQLLPSLLAQSGVGSPSFLPHSLSGIALHKLVEEEDPQGLLEWALRLLPLLSGVGPDCSPRLAGLHSGVLPGNEESCP